MTAGTLVLTNNSDVATGTGTTFTTELVAGDFVVATVGGITYTLPVKSVDTDSQLTFISKYPGPTQANSAWSAVPRATQNQVTAALVAQTTEALRGLNYDKANWQAVFSASGDITVILPDGSTFTGPSWNKIATLLENIDPVALQALADQVNSSAQQVAADKLDVATKADQVHADAQATALAAISAEQSETGAQQAKEEAGQSAQEALDAKTAIGDVQAAVDAVNGVATLPLGFTFWWANRATIPTGAIAYDGLVYPYATYPGVKASRDNGSLAFVTDAVWQADTSKRSYFATVDADHFRSPDLNGVQPGSIAQAGLAGGTAAQVGMFHGTAPNIKGTKTGIIMTLSGGTGALKPVSTAAGNILQGTGGGVNYFTLEFDASAYNAIYSDAATDILPARAVGVWCGQLFGRVTNPGDLDAATLSARMEAIYAELLAKQNRALIRGLDVAVTTNVWVGPGACALPDGSIINVPGSLAVAFPVLAANTWYHLYLYNNSGVPALEISTTAPVAYSYPAHQKTGDPTRRYIGSMRSNGSSVMYNQTSQNGQCIYQSDWANQRVLGGGVSTTFVAMSIGGGVPITANEVRFSAYNNGSGTGIAVICPRNDNSAIGSVFRTNGGAAVVDLAIQDYPSMYYKYTTTPGGSAFYVDIGGYKYAR